MLQEAVEFYHQLLEDGEVAESSRRMLDEGLERAKLIFGGRRLSPYLRPHFVTEQDFERVSSICETVWGAIQKVKDAAVEDATLLDELGITEIERELVAIDPGYRAVSPTARLDSFLIEDDYHFVELNGESPAGIAYADAAYEIFSELPAMRRFGERYNLRRFHGRPLMLETLLEAQVLIEDWRTDSRYAGDVRSRVSGRLGCRRSGVEDARGVRSVPATLRPGGQ